MMEIPPNPYLNALHLYDTPYNLLSIEEGWGEGSTISCRPPS